MSHATDILQAAGIAIDTRGVERDRPDGERSMATAVKTFAAMTGRGLTETEGWLFMVCLKAARATGGAYREDDYTDMAAYAALAGESASGIAPGQRTGCRHTATITSDDGKSTICASCSLHLGSMEWSAPDAILLDELAAGAAAFSEIRDANRVEYAKMQKPTPPPGREVTEGVQPKRECGFFADVTQWANRTIGKTKTAESAMLDAMLAPGAIYHPEPLPEFCKDFAKAHAVELARQPKSECTHRYVQLTTGGLICADCKAPWSK